MIAWTIQYGHLVADAEGCRFDVEQQADGWQAQVQLFKKMPLETYTMRNRSPVLPSLQEAMSWCDLRLKIWLAPLATPKPDEEWPDVMGSGLGAAPAVSLNPLQSFDARDWAQEFMRGNRHVAGGTMVAVDEETMVGWFSNALMRGYDERTGEMQREAALPPSPEATQAELDKVEREMDEDLKETGQPSPEATEPQGFKCPECGSPFWGTTEWQRGPAEGNCHGWTNDGLRCRFSWIRSPEEDLKLGITNEAPPWFYAPGPPSDLERLETTMRLHHEWTTKNLANLRETLQMRTDGLDGPALKRRLGDLERRYAGADEARKP